MTQPLFEIHLNSVLDALPSEIAIPIQGGTENDSPKSIQKNQKGHFVTDTGVFYSSQNIRSDITQEKIFIGDLIRELEKSRRISITVNRTGNIIAHDMKPTDTEEKSSLSSSALILFAECFGSNELENFGITDKASFEQLAAHVFDRYAMLRRNKLRKMPEIYDLEAIQKRLDEPLAVCKKKGEDKSLTVLVLTGGSDFKGELSLRVISTDHNSFPDSYDGENVCSFLKIQEENGSLYFANAKAIKTILSEHVTEEEIMILNEVFEKRNTAEKEKHLEGMKVKLSLGSIKDIIAKRKASEQEEK